MLDCQEFLSSLLEERPDGEEDEPAGNPRGDDLEGMLAEMIEQNTRLAIQADRAKSLEAGKKLLDNLERRVLLDILPSDILLRDIQSRFDIEVLSYHRFSDKLGGDSWGLKPVDDGRLAFYLADFAGHGVEVVGNLYRLDSLLSAAHDLQAHPARMLAHLNEGFCRVFEHGEFLCLTYGVVDFRFRRFTCATAGVVGPVVASTGDGAGDVPVQCLATGIPLGITQNETYDE